MPRCLYQEAMAFGPCPYCRPLGLFSLHPVRPGLADESDPSLFRPGGQGGGCLPPVACHPMMALYTLHILVDLGAPGMLKKAVPGMESAALVSSTELPSLGPQGCGSLSSLRMPPLPRAAPLAWAPEAGRSEFFSRMWLRSRCAPIKTHPEPWGF